MLYFVCDRKTINVNIAPGERIVVALLGADFAHVLALIPSKILSCFNGQMIAQKQRKGR